MSDKDIIYRQDAKEAYCKKLCCSGVFCPDVGVCKEVNETFDAIPSAQPERLTDDDFETIRIHLNACKEKLCNQQRWEEAEEYQRIIDRFMAFVSAQLDAIPLEWITKHLEWLDNCDNDFAQLAKVSIRAMVELWGKDRQSERSRQ